MFLLLLFPYECFARLARCQVDIPSILLTRLIILCGSPKQFHVQKVQSKFLVLISFQFSISQTQDQVYASVPIIWYQVVFHDVSSLQLHQNRSQCCRQPYHPWYHLPQESCLYPNPDLRALWVPYLYLRQTFCQELMQRKLDLVPIIHLLPQTFQPVAAFPFQDPLQLQQQLQALGL